MSLKSKRKENHLNEITGNTNKKNEKGDNYNERCKIDQNRSWSVKTVSSDRHPPIKTFYINLCKTIVVQPLVVLFFINWGNFWRVRANKCFNKSFK